MSTQGRGHPAGAEGSSAAFTGGRKVSQGSPENQNQLEINIHSKIKIYYIQRG